MLLFFRAIFLYFFVIIAIRIMGKRQIGELQPFELVTTIMLSELAALPMQDVGIPMIKGLIPIIALVILEVFTSFLTLKFQFFRKIFCGVPSIVIKDGKLVESELRKLRFNLDDLMEELRVLGIVDIDCIAYGVMETSGKLSVIPRYSKSPITHEDLKMSGREPKLPISVIMDGKVNLRNLHLLGRDENWLLCKLNERHIYSFKDVFIAIIDSNQNLFIQKKGESNENEY